MKHRLYLLAIFLPLVLDAGLNCLLCGGSWRNTMSGEAWQQRTQPVWFWTHDLIDALFFFQPGHCQLQAAREAQYGSVWRAWAADWRFSA